MRRWAEKEIQLVRKQIKQQWSVYSKCMYMDGGYIGCSIEEFCALLTTFSEALLLSEVRSMPKAMFILNVATAHRKTIVLAPESTNVSYVHV